MRRSTCTKKQTATARLNEYEVSPHIHSILNQKLQGKIKKANCEKAICLSKCSEMRGNEKALDPLERVPSGRAVVLRMEPLRVSTLRASISHAKPIQSLREKEQAKSRLLNALPLFSNDRGEVLLLGAGATF